MKLAGAAIRKRKALIGKEGGETPPPFTSIEAKTKPVFVSDRTQALSALARTLLFQGARKGSHEGTKMMKQEEKKERRPQEDEYVVCPLVG